MSGPITEPGWYWVGPKGGLVWHCGLDEDPEDIADVPLTGLVRVEVDPAAAVEEPLF